MSDGALGGSISLLNNEGKARRDAQDSVVYLAGSKPCLLCYSKIEVFRGTSKL